MPKVAMDYSNTHFYRIVCKNLEIKNCYIGHTLNFTKRRTCHKCICNKESSKYYNQYLYKFIRENGGWENWQMVLIDSHNFNNREDVLKKEREYIENYNATLNQYPPIISKEEKKARVDKYQEDNKDYLIQQKKVYCDINKDAISERRKKYYNEHEERLNEINRNYHKQNKEKYDKTRQLYYNKNKDQLLEQKQEYYRKNRENILEKKKEYHLNNKDKRNEYHKEYYEQNRDRILERERQKVSCQCGSSVRHSDIRRHERSKKHQDYINSLQD